MLITRSSEQEVLFPQDQASPMYAGTTELNAVAERPLQGPQLRSQLRLSAHKLAEPHTYVNRAKQLLKFLGL